MRFIIRHLFITLLCLSLVVAETAPCYATDANYRVSGFGSNDHAELGIDGEEVAETVIHWFTILAASSIGLFLGVRCRHGIKNASLIFFILGSLLYIGSEIYGLIKYRQVGANSMQIHIASLRSKEYKDGQVAALEALKTRVEEYKEVTDNKWKIMAGVVSAFGAALLSTIIEGIAILKNSTGFFEKYFVLKCLGQKKGEDAKSMPDGIHSNSIPQSSPVPTLLPAFLAELNIPGLEMKKLEQLTPYLAQLEQLLLIPSAQATDASTAVNPSPTPSPIDTESSAGEVLTVGNIMKIVGLSSGTLLGLGLAIFTKVDGMATKFLAHPLTRGIFFAVLVGISGYLLHLIKRKVEILENRKNYLQSIINGVKNFNTNQVIADPTLDSLLPPPPAILAGENSQLQRKGQGPCLKAIGNRFMLDRACECKKSPSGCGGGVSQPVNPQGFNYPPSMSQPLTSLNSSYNSLANGNMLSAGLSSGQLGFRGAALTRLKKDALDKLNEVLKEQGKEPFELDAKANSLSAAIKKAVRKEFDNANLNPANLKDFSPLLEINSSPVDEQVKKEAKAALAESKGSAGGGTTSSENAKAGEELFDFSLGDEEAAALGDLSAPEGGEEKMEDFEETYHDISQDKSENIFKLLSKRYLLTAFPILLEESTPTEEKNSN